MFKPRSLSTLLALLLVAGVSAAAEPASAQAAEPFFAALGTGGQPSCDALVRMSPASDASTPATSPAPQAPVELTGCTAEKTCFGGNVISCSGTTSCSVNCGSVICDGTQIECTCTAGCGSPAYCACRSCGGPHHLCFQNWCV